jgi:hypothetical protein
MTAQVTREYPAASVGVPTSIVLDYRFDDGALEEIMKNKSGSQLRDKLIDYLKAVEIDRGDSPSEIANQRADVAVDMLAPTQAMGAVFDQAAAKYRRLLSAEEAVISTLGPIGARAVEVRFPIDAASQPDYEKATARSLAQARSKIATEMFDDLLSSAQATGRRPEQVVAYGLLALTPASRSDLRVDIDMNLEDTWDQVNIEYRASGYAGFDKYAKGSAVSRIDGGLFGLNIDKLLDVD